MDKKFHIKSINVIGTWKRALNMARQTVGLKPIDKEPSSLWKRSILLAEHSPIREVVYDIFWDNIKQRISVHYVRHHEGIEKFVHTQRDDRNNDIVNSDDLPQGAFNDMAISVNAQAIINISKVRLCSKASADTRYVWQETLKALKEIDPILVEKCVPTCIYRGFCPEKECCGFVRTKKFISDLKKYRLEGTDINIYEE